MSAVTLSDSVRAYTESDVQTLIGARCFDESFGGYKEPGLGRKTCKGTLDEYTERKPVAVSLGAAS